MDITPEVLGFAAKAAGCTLKWPKGPNGSYPYLIRETEDMVMRSEGWNPEHSDGDAYRLALACRLSIEIHDETDGTYSVSVNRFVEVFESGYFVDNGFDLMAATRKAILLTASTIGKAMP